MAEKSRIIAVRVGEKLDRKITRYAKENGRDVSGTVRYALEKLFSKTKGR